MDSSKKGLDAMLMQDGGVIEYVSWNLKHHEELYAMHYLDLGAMILSLKLWTHYLVGKICVLKID
jgi:hypothetical protein